MKAAYASCVVRCEPDVESWTDTPPLLDRVRPRCCVKCGSSAWLGSKRRIVSHGRRLRRVLRWSSSSGAQPIWVTALRFRCTVEGCGAVMLVVPRDVAPGRHYSAPAIGMAVCLWAYGSRPAHGRAERPARPSSPAHRAWAQPRRWVGAATAGGLFTLGLRLEPGEPAKGRALSLASQLAGAALPDGRHGQLEDLAASGAVVALDGHHACPQRPTRPTKFVACPARRSSGLSGHC